MNKRILSTLLALCMMLALLPGTALAAVVATGKCGNSSTWQLDSNGTLTFKGTGSAGGYYNNFDAPWYAKRNDIKKVVVSEGITSIGSECFHGYSNITSIELPESLTSIARQVFDGCKNLKTIKYAGTVEQWNDISVNASSYSVLYSADSRITYAKSPSTSTLVSGNSGNSTTWQLDSNGTLTFKGTGSTGGYYNNFNAPWYARRDGIKRVVISEGITGIGSENFHGYSNIASVELPESLTSIARQVFDGCRNLKTIYYHGSPEQWTEILINASNNSVLYAADAQIIFNYVPPAATCTVTFSPQGGTISQTSKQVTNGRTYGSLPTPTRSGYTFKGWYTASSGGSKVTASTTVTNSSNHTLYAQWTKAAAKTCKVTFNPSGGTVSTKTRTLTQGSAYGTLPVPTRSGYTFSGWYTSSSGGTRITSTSKVPASTAKTLYARWTKDTAPKTYLITFNPNGGSVFTRYAAVVNGGTYRSLPTPSYSGRHFAGWYTASSGGVKVTPQTKVSLTGNKTLYAHWTTSPVSVRSMETGSWRVTVPSGSRLALYSSETSAAQATSATNSRDTALTCTRMAVLSNGTVRYYTRINSKNYWFCYSDEMAVN